ASYWMREWYPESTDVLVHVHKLSMRLALVRLLLFLHPQLDGRSPSDPSAAAALDEAIVDVFYRISRGLERDEAFNERLAAALADEQHAESIEKELLRF